MITVFVMQTRGVVDIFNHAHGLYADVWTAWVEGVVNLAVTITAAYYLGIAGVLLGKIASILPIIVFWKPYYLFSTGFKLPVKVLLEADNPLLFFVCCWFFSLYLAKPMGSFQARKKFWQSDRVCLFDGAPFYFLLFLLITVWCYRNERFFRPVFPACTIIKK